MPKTKNQRRLNTERRRWRRRLIRTAAHRKYRTYRFMSFAFWILLALYLASSAHFGHLLLNVGRERTVEIREEGEDKDKSSLWQELYKVTFRLRSGELEFYHEKRANGNP